MSCPFIVPRSQWQAREPIGELDKLALPGKYAVFGHTVGAECPDLERCMNAARIIQLGHFSSMFDIAYNFLIGGDGSILEGRGWFNKGAFNKPFNAHGHGIAFFGNFTDLEVHTPSLAARQAATALVRCGMSEGHILGNATAASFYMDPLITSWIEWPVLDPPAVTEPSTTDSVLTWALPVVFCVLSMLVFLGTLCYLKSKKKQLLSALGRERFLQLIPKSVLEKYEIRRSRLKLGRIISSGNFGQVRAGSLVMEGKSMEEREIQVAIKTPRAAWQSIKGHMEFVAETCMLIKLHRHHRNIVNLLGVVLCENIMLVMEFCELGSLDVFLRASRPWFEERKDVTKSGKDSGTNLANVDTLVNAGTPVRRLQTEDLMRFGCEISRGMEFLASRSVVHRDLAARNVLLDSEMTVKIADFGMACEAGRPNSTRSREISLPVRWMAPELIISSDAFRVNVQGDVWSFGVVMWEIFTLGQFPYGDQFKDRLSREDLSNLLNMLQQGERLAKPDLCPPEIFSICQECWNLDPSARPAFTEVRTRIESFVPPGTREGYVRFDVENETINQKLDGMFHSHVIACLAEQGLVRDLNHGTEVPSD